MSPPEAQGPQGGRVPGRAQLGLSQDFAVGDHVPVERALEELQALGVTRLRTELSWAQTVTPAGEAWAGWLLPRLSRDVELLVAVRGTPAGLAVRGLLPGATPRESAPPREPAAFVDFVRRLVSRWGAHVHAVELWPEPGLLTSYDLRLDPGFRTYVAMVRGAAEVVRAAGLKAVLGALRPVDPLWLAAMCEQGVVDGVDAVAVAALPGHPAEPAFEGWEATLAPVQAGLARAGARAELWVTRTGHSAHAHDERGQVEALLAAAAAPASRIYWHALQDAQAPGQAADGWLATCGLRDAEGTPRLLGRLWALGGLAQLERMSTHWAPVRARPAGERPVLVVGGAGFVGCNLADAYLAQGRRVRVLDNLSRPGVELNLRWLKERHGDRCEVEVGDVRDARVVARAVEGAAEVFHFAAQVAVTTSLTGPVRDFEVNARGTLQVLEAIRAQEEPPPLLFTSTNKVYGCLPHLPVQVDGRRYAPVDPELRARGLSEATPLDFESPYGCSKGAADQYVLDYARSYGLQACVFRMSCIYGPRQFGTEDQGWVAHFLLRALTGQGITLYGDGMQVRDILDVGDLVRAFRAAMGAMERVSGQAFNLGGGPERTVSLLELLSLIEELTGRRPQVHFEGWRTGDQRYYVSDTRRLQAAVGWRPEVGVREGVTRLLRWLEEMRGMREREEREWTDGQRERTAAEGEALEAAAH